MTGKAERRQEKEGGLSHGADQDKTADQEERKGTKDEVGGPGGPEPTRYGDWEIGGKCVDF